MPNKDNEERSINTTPVFKMVLLIVTGLTLILLAIHVVIAFSYANPTKPQEGLVEAVGTCWKMGVGAIIGLLGGKAT